MLLQPVPFPTSPRASYKHYCHLPSISPLCVRQEHWALSGKETSLSQGLRHRIKRHLNTDLCFVLLPIILLYQTPPHEHSTWSFSICDFVPPLSFKTPFCCVHSDRRHYKCHINMSLNTCHTPLPAIFRGRRHSPVTCQRRGMLKDHLPLFPFSAQGQTHLPEPPLRGGQLPHFTVTLHQAAPINSFTHQFRDKSESTSPPDNHHQLPSAL